MKLLRILMMLLALLGHPQAWASTPVCGLVDDEIWTATGSPYLVTCDVTVASLVIQPGVEVRFQGNYVFMVQGILKVQGAEGPNQVRFTTTNAAVGWQGIWFLDALQGSSFYNCIIEHSKNSGVRITNGLPVGGGVPAFTNCSIINNSSPEYGGGINATLTSGNLVLDNCLIGTNTSGIYGGGINAVLSTGMLRMVQCTNVANVVNVATTAGRGGGFRGGGIRVAGDSMLLNCVVADNLCNARAQLGAHCGESYGGGLYSEAGNANLRNCHFYRNKCETFESVGCSTSVGGAVYFGGGHLTMQNSIVATNTCIAVDNQVAAGVIISSGTAYIINCTIVGNSTHGLYQSGGLVNCTNSILFFNNSSAEQIGGSVIATWSDVQGGYPGEGNKAVNPNLNPSTFELTSNSPCIDTGNPNPVYYDLCFPPSRGTSRNDMGAHGGPGGCGWPQCITPSITSQPVSDVACVGEQVYCTVTANGTGPLFYQWYRAPNQLIPNAISAWLTLNSVQLLDGGDYYAVITNGCGSVTSLVATVTVSPICVSLDIYPGLTLRNLTVGNIYGIEWTPSLADTNTWLRLTNLQATASHMFWLDPEPAHRNRKFYRVTPAP